MAGFAPGSDEGPVYDFHGASIVIKASGDDTLGQLGVMESAYPASAVSPPARARRRGQDVSPARRRAHRILRRRPWDGNGRQFRVRAPRSPAWHHRHQQRARQGHRHYRTIAARSPDRGARTTCRQPLDHPGPQTSTRRMRESSAPLGPPECCLVRRGTVQNQGRTARISTYSMIRRCQSSSTCQSSTRAVACCPNGALGARCSRCPISRRTGAMT
jgi:hypothetical protein